MEQKSVSVLGTEYKIIFKKYTEDKLFEKDGIDGYCNNISREIVVCCMSTYPGYEKESALVIETVQKEILRHEITHAFLKESGLCASSLNYSGGWACNEEMVDWIALQGLKIYEAWKQADCI